MRTRTTICATLGATALLGQSMPSPGHDTNASPATPPVALDAPADATQSVQHLPRPLVKKVRRANFDPYGAAAKSAGLEGRVAVTFKLAPDGKATLVSIAAYDEPQLAYSARDMFPLLEFAPPPAAPPDGANEYVLGIVFCLKPSGVHSEFPPEAHVLKGNTIVISGSRLPGAPVKTQKRDDVPAECK